MALKQKILDDLKSAMKAGDSIRRDTLRMLDAMIKNVEIEKHKKGEGLKDEEVMEVVARGIKQRKDAAEQYAAGGRADLEKKEKSEILILMGYMPAQMDGEKVEEEVKKIIVELGAQKKSEMGRVMGEVMKRLKGKADGSLVKKIVEKELK